MATQQKEIIKIPKKFGPRERQVIANLIISRIKERTLSGLDKNNRPFKRYAQSYVSSKEFQRAGKNRNTVNLRFTGEMINEIELLSHGEGFIVIGFESSTEVNDKASFNAEKGREFLGITQKDLSEILSRVPAENTEQEEQILEIPSLIGRILRGFSES